MSAETKTTHQTPDQLVDAFTFQAGCMQSLLMQLQASVNTLRKTNLDPALKKLSDEIHKLSLHIQPQRFINFSNDAKHWLRVANTARRPQ